MSYNGHGVRSHDDRYVKCPNCDYLFIIEDHSILTKRQVEVAMLLGEGKTTSEVAEILFISEKTVESHRQIIYRKTVTRNPAELTRWVIRQGLIEA